MAKCASDLAIKTTKMNSDLCINPQIKCPERSKKVCDGCGRPVPARCPSCHACHCTANCRYKNHGHDLTLNEITYTNNRWLGVIGVALCILLTIVVITLIICIWYYSDRLAVKEEVYVDSSDDEEPVYDLTYDEYNYFR